MSGLEEILQSHLQAVIMNLYSVSCYDQELLFLYGIEGKTVEDIESQSRTLCIASIHALQTQPQNCHVSFLYCLMICREIEKKFLTMKYIKFTSIPKKIYKMLQPIRRMELCEG